MALLTPLVLKWLIDLILPRREMGLLLCAVLLIFLAYQCRMALTSLGTYLTLSAAQRMALALRVTLVRHLDSLSADYYDNAPVGAVLYPFQEPVDEISYFGSDLLPAVLRTLFTLVFTLATMFMLSPALTLAVVPLVPAFLIARHHYRRKLAIDSDGLQHDRVEWNSFLQEHLASAISIQLLRQERRQERKAFRLLARTVRSEQKLFGTGVRFTLSTSLAVVSAVSAVIGYGGWCVLAGTLSLGSLVAFYSFVTQLFDPLSGVSELYARSQKTLASIRQVQALLARRPAVTDSSITVSFPQEHPADIELIAVEFGYNRLKQMLSVPSLRILSGEQVAIAGENGAGKSTLAKLMARIYDVDSGSIRIGGQDVRSIRLDSLRREVCYLSRNPVLFDGTLGFNLRFARPGVSDDELQQVIRCTGLSDLVASVPEGLRQRIGPGGCQLSGGQQQRLAIARALLQRPQIIILDEATSCLDPSSEIVVLSNIRRRLGASTLIVITHRLSTVSTFGRVLVLSDGRIVEDERLGACISRDSAYYKLFASAISERDSAVSRLND